MNALSADDASSTVHRVTSTTPKTQYLITARPAYGLHTLDPSAMMEVVENALNDDPEIEIVRTLRSRVTVCGVSGTYAEPAPRVLVARMSDERAALLRLIGVERGIVVERDDLLALAHEGMPDPGELGLLDVAAIAPFGNPTHIEVLVIGHDETPLENAQVVLYGPGLPAEAITDSRGRARLTLAANALEMLRSLYVKPAADHWDVYLQHPSFHRDRLNVIQLTSLAVQLPAWGQKAMRLDSLPAEYTGRGVKVAVVDSGIATTHPALSRVNHGIDVRNQAAPDAWRSDASSHGTHCAGVIGGAPLSNVHVRGIAPETELIACKVFPGGHFSDLVDAVDYCISQQVDVINLCLASQHTSEVVERKLAEAKAHGVACIVAAGNTGGPVQFPARSQHVLAVSAIGKLNEFPNHTYHAQTVTGDRRAFGSEGYFPAKFSCYGEQVAVCGPGVAVIGAVSPHNFAVLDGTSLAAAHVSGLAALILAHHPDFKERYRTRNALRVERLFEIIRQSARPMHVDDVRRVGAGLPDAWRALGLEQNASKEVRESMNTGFHVLREQLRGAGLSGDGDLLGSQRSPQRSGHAGYRNGATRPTSSHGDHGSARIISALLLSELRKHMEEAQLIAAEPEPPRAVAEAE